MACPKCAIDSESHSFRIIGTSAGVTIVHTAPARAKDVKDYPEKLGYLKQHLEPFKAQPWIWVFDCRNMKARNYNPMETSRGLAAYLGAEHESVLRAILVIHPNPWVKALMKLFQGFLPRALYSKVKFMSGKGLELLVGLEKEGIHGGALRELV